MIRITLTKLGDCENPHHPLHIPAGHVVNGWLVDEPEIGKAFWVNAAWRTSLVTEIINKDNFKTMNSLYKITRYEEQSSS